jgi:hypothetical protein
MLVRMRKLRKVAAALAAAFATALLSAHSAFAQGCALCYNDASAASPHGIAALRHGILVLGIPPMLIFAAIVFTLYRRRNFAHDVMHPATSLNRARSASEIILNL